MQKKRNVPHYPIFKALTIQNQDCIQLDADTRRNLELTQNLAGGTNTLSSVLDKCVTPMGSPLMKRWIHQPVRDVEKLKQRQQSIAEILNFDLVDELQPYLQLVGDMERILARVAAFSTSTISLAYAQP